MSVASALGRVVDRSLVQDGDVRPYLVDETETRSLAGRADAVVTPNTPAEVAAVVRFAYEHDVPVVPRGGGTGYAGGCVPVDGGIVLALERIKAVRQFDPLLWRLHVDAGVTTAHVRSLVRSSGLYFPPDPGAAEQSHIGGNVATNAGGPHAFKYGTTGAWVTGLEVVLPPGEVVRVGGSFRKDASAYDLKHLLVGSEGTLGVITAVWLRLIPPPAAAYPVVGLYPDAATGCAAIEAVLGNGIPAAALEYVDGGALRAAPPTFARELESAAFAVLVEVDGAESEAAALRDEVAAVLAEDAVEVHAPVGAPEVATVWRWREGMTAGVTAARGGKVSEDIAVPVDRLLEAVQETIAIGERHGLPACSWGHAGDGNIHSTFLVDRADRDEVERAERAAADLFALAGRLEGTISGEHGLGYVKSGFLAETSPPEVVALHRGIKQVFDPKGLLNPGKKC